MAEQLAAANKAFKKLVDINPNADYASFIAGWNQCLEFNQEKGS